MVVDAIQAIWKYFSVAEREENDVNKLTRDLYELKVLTTKSTTEQTTAETESAF